MRYLLGFLKQIVVYLLQMTKNLVGKYFLFILKMVTILGVCYFVYGLYQDKSETDRKYKELIGKEEKFKRISDYVANLEKLYLSEKQMNEEAEKRWGKDRKYLEGKIKVLLESTFVSKNPEYNEEETLGNNPSVVEVSIFNEDNKKGLPLCYVRWDKANKIYKKVYNFEINIDTGISRNEDDGKYFILTKANLVLLEKPLIDSAWLNKPFPLKIKNGTAIIDPTESSLKSKIYWFNPKLNGGLSFGVNKSGFFSKPVLGITWMGYGATKNDLKWKFLNTGIDFDSDFTNPGVAFSPFLYRPFNSLIVNTYIGPGVNFNSRGTGYFLGLSLGF